MRSAMTGTSLVEIVSGFCLREGIRCTTRTAGEAIWYALVVGASSRRGAERPVNAPSAKQWHEVA